MIEVLKAVVIPVEGPIREVEFPDEDPGSWPALVDGEGVDFITLREMGLQVLVDDRSILDGKPLNTRMTWFLRGTGRWLSEVYGTALLVGIHPYSGETVDVDMTLAAVIVTETPG